MVKNSAYISGIPVDAKEVIASGKPGSRSSKCVKNYYVGKELVGTRTYQHNGLIEYECTVRDGQRDGWEYEFDSAGNLHMAVPFRQGLEHGTARIWGDSGNLLGTYTKENGTGLFLYWGEFDGTAQLTVASYSVNGVMHGTEYWFCWFLPGFLWKERSWQHGTLNGVEREWNCPGELRHGFPKFWAGGHAIHQDEYITMSRNNPELPQYVPAEDQPIRSFPAEIAVYLPRLPDSDAKV